MGPGRQAKVVFLLSLWPFVLFVSFLGVLYILIIAGAVSPASSGGDGPGVLFVLQGVKSPAMAAPVLSIIIGFIMAIGILDSGVDRKATKTATRATIFAFPSPAVYAYLLWTTAGIGR